MHLYWGSPLAMGQVPAPHPRPMRGRGSGNETPCQKPMHLSPPRTRAMPSRPGCRTAPRGGGGNGSSTRRASWPLARALDGTPGSDAWAPARTSCTVARWTARCGRVAVRPCWGRGRFGRGGLATAAGAAVRDPSPRPWSASRPKPARGGGEVRRCSRRRAAANRKPAGFIQGESSAGGRGTRNGAGWGSFAVPTFTRLPCPQRGPLRRCGP